MGQAYNRDDLAQLQLSLQVLQEQLGVLDQFSCTVAAAHLAQAHFELSEELQKRMQGRAVSNPSAGIDPFLRH